MSQKVLTSVEKFDTLIRKDRRYQPEAYSFIYEALDWTLKNIVCETNIQGKHVSGGELLEGIRQYAIEKFGPLVPMVFSEWGLTRTDDWGEIVFNLIDYDLLGKQQSDRKEDFQKIYDFNKAFNLDPEFHYNKRKSKWKVVYRTAQSSLEAQNPA